MINLYYHGGSLNHGCEAIVRSTKKIINQDITLYTTNIEADKKYGLDLEVFLKEDTYIPLKKKSIQWFASAIYNKIFHNDYLYIKYARKQFFSNVKSGQIYMSIGGDNYCYAGRDILGYYNTLIHKRGGKTVLWGCSFEPSDLNDQIKSDLERYDLIIARESFSYEALSKVNKHTILLPDPAFQLDKIELPLPEGFVEGNTVGINVSPLIMDCEKQDGITYLNYKRLIENIIENSDMQIALIPHVVEEKNDDRVPLRELFKEFSKTGRVLFLDDCNAMELKGFISRCRFFVGARTHATIAAYSTHVPTLVVGYSIKAKGIAYDIFGTDQNYVLPVDTLKQEEDLTKAFEWIQQRENEIREHLHSYMPSYCEMVWEAGKMIRGISE